MITKKKQEVFDPSFYQLANEVTRAIERNKDGSTQEQQVVELMEAEHEFKMAVLAFKRHSNEIYHRFLQKICLENKNILSARPYFRENAVTFSEKITPAIKAGDVETLKTFNINYQFIKFIMDNWHLPKKEKEMAPLFKRVHRARTVLIENNMPLAINRAKLFYRKTPKSHLSLMDMIGICSQGLAAGVDKWCGKYSPVFRSVCIGRMVGNLIDSYSETSLHFFPSDRRILYKANSIRGRQKIDDINELSKAVNQGFKDDKELGKGSLPKEEVTPSQLAELLAAASMVSADSVVNEEGYDIYHFTSDGSKSSEDSLVENESIRKVILAMSTLPLLHKKVLKLKGIEI
jgi:DNA-directed RNA polymerase specialized sigma subunit